MLADTHLGMRSNSPEWLDIAAGWMEDHLIPALRAEVLPGDVFVHLGDVFDSRQSLNLLVQHRGIRLFEQLADVFKDGAVHVIAGNHDVMRKSSNEVCSLDCLKWIPRVTVHKEPSTLQLGPSRALLMPWRPGPQEERDCVAGLGGGSDYLFCHTNFLGMSLGDHQVDGDALSVRDLSSFKRVFAGHIHLRQTLANVHMLGNPYQMTRADGGNQKGWFVLDVEADRLDFRVNDVSPKFKRVYLPQWADRSIDELIAECDGHMVDLYVPSGYFVAGYGVASVTAELSGKCRSLEVVAYDDSVDADLPHVDVGSQFNVLDLCRKYVVGMGALDVPTRERVEAKLADLYKQVQEQ